MSAEADAVLMRRFVAEIIEEALNRGEMTILDEVCMPTCICYTHMEQGVMGVEELKKSLTILRIAYPDLQVILDDLRIHDNTIVAGWQAQASHQGAYHGLPPTGKPILVRGLATLRLMAGKIVEIWIERTGTTVMPDS